MKNYIIKLSTLVLIAFMPYAGMAKNDESFSVKGVVNSKEERLPMSHAMVHIDGTTIATVTNEKGEFELENIPVGEHKIVVSFLGYEPFNKIVAQETFLDVSLAENALNVDEVVVTANRYATKKREAVSIVGTVAPKLFEQTGSTTSADVLNFQTGMRVEWNCGNCGVPQLRINGLEGQYSQILIDSRPLMSSLTSVYGLELFPSSMIERVEVLRGGGSAIFGSNAIGGVVNIITKETKQNSLMLSNQTSIFEGGGIDANTTLNGSFVTDDNRTGVFLFGSVRDRDAYDRNGDGFSELPRLESQAIGFRAFQKIKEHSKLTLEYHHLSEYRRGGDSLELPPHRALLAEQLKHKIDGGGLKYDFRTKNERGDLSVYTSFQNTKRDSYFGTHQNLDAYGKTCDFVFVGGAQFDYSFSKLFFMPSIMTIGAEYNSDDLTDEMFGYNRVINQHSQTVGGYFQNEWKNDKLSLLVGVRVDKNNMVDNVIASPRVSARYAPLSWLTFRTSYSTGYRAPQAYDEDLHVAAVGGDVAIIKLSDNLKTERSQSLNGSVDFYKVFGGVQVNVLAEGFYTDLKNVFTLEELGHDDMGNLILEKRNSEGAKVKGLNVEARVAIGSKFNFQSGYTFQRSLYKNPFKWSTNENVTPQRQMFRSPNSYGYITVSGDPVKNFNISLSSNFTGKMYVQHFAGFIAEDRTEITKPFVDMGVRLAYKVKISKQLNFELSTGVKNVFDSFQTDLDDGADKDSKYFYGPALPRTYYVGAKFMLF